LAVTGGVRMAVGQVPGSTMCLLCILLICTRIIAQDRGLVKTEVARSKIDIMHMLW
jgi:hypothetical protein